MAHDPSRMHTVPKGYLRAFADSSAPRRNPCLWCFQRGAANEGQGRPISLDDASVKKDIYALRTGEDKTTRRLRRTSSPARLKTLSRASFSCWFPAKARLTGSGAR